MVKLFSYGTLQQENVQLASFGRLLSGTLESVEGYKLIDLEIIDFDVISKSGKNIHKIMVFTGNDTDKVDGTVFDLSKEELAIADNYEVEDYSREPIKLKSGEEAYAYISKNSASGVYLKPN